MSRQGLNRYGGTIILHCGENTGWVMNIEDPDESYRKVREITRK